MKLFAGVVVFIALGAVAFYFLSKESVLTTSEVNHKAKELDGQTVAIKGLVVGNLSFMGYGGYLISDGKSKVLVLSENGVPSHGVQTEVFGVFRNAMSINGYEYNLIYQGEKEQ